jgi:hypothetical protein
MLQLVNRALAFIFVAITLFSFAQDSLISVFKQKMAIPEGGSLAALAVRMANSFLGTPYEAHTLEGNKREELVCKFDGLDCTTLVDNVIALSISRKNQGDFGDFKDELTKLRYRNGTISGYASRLHYFIDWLYENQKSGQVEDVTQSLGGVPFTKNIHFMTSHSELYKPLSIKEEWEEVQQAEDSINSRSYYYIPAYSIRKIEPMLREGDIIGITSSIEGLDCNHQGIVTKMGNRAYLIHASSAAHKVVVSAQPLAEYVSSIKKNTGIIVARLVE